MHCIYNYNVQEEIKTFMCDFFQDFIGRAVFHCRQLKAGKVVFAFTKVACVTKLILINSNLEQCASKSVARPNIKQALHLLFV